MRGLSGSWLGSRRFILLFERTSRTVRIKPGRYRTVARAPGDESIKPYVGDWDLSSGYIYDDCYYIKRSS